MERKDVSSQGPEELGCSGLVTCPARNLYKSALLPGVQVRGEKETNEIKDTLTKCRYLMQFN